VGIDLPVEAYRRQVLVAEPPEGEELEYTVPMVIESRIDDKQPGIYVRDELGDALILSYFTDDEWNDETEDPADPDSYDRGYDEEFALNVLDEVEHRAPRFAEFPITNGWAGLHITSADGQPILDRHPELEGYFVATGFSGKGFQIAPMTGELMADLVMYGEPQAMDHMEPYRLARFDGIT